MEKALTSIFIFSVLLMTFVLLGRVGLHAYSTLGESWQGAMEQSERRLQSDIAVTAVSSNGFEWNVQVENEGRTAIEEFSGLDVIMQYTDASGSQVKWLPYASALEPNSWTVAAIFPDEIDAGVVNQQEVLNMTVCIDPPIADATLNWLQVNTEFGTASSRTFAGEPVVGTCSACPAGNTGWTSATAEAATSGGSGDGFELTPEGAFSDGGAIARNVRSPGDRHLYSGYGLSISSLCEITGIEVRLDWWLAILLGTNSMSVELSWDGGTSWATAKTDATETTSEHTTILGGASDAWGHTWTNTQLLDANFVARVTGNCTGSPSCLLQDFNLDWIPVRIHVGPKSS